ncbi:MAG: DUF11 domain-containing protein, partial [Phycisphaerae bacterium]|nr:DUF11 domain-containing protein [Phycisphaerae bacterium]
MAQNRPIEPSPPIMQEPVKPEPIVKPEPMVAESKCGPYIVTRTYPCEGCGQVELKKTMPKMVQINGQFDYNIEVTNLTDMDVDDVLVTEMLANNFKFVSSAPTAETEPGKLTWALGKLGPN